jgi:carbonic anhydrase
MATQPRSTRQARHKAVLPLMVAGCTVLALLPLPLAGRAGDDHAGDKAGSAAHADAPGHAEGHAGNAPTPTRGSGSPAAGATATATAPSKPATIRPVNASRSGTGAGGRSGAVAVTSLTAEQALAALREGNARWAAERAESPNTGSQRRQLMAQGGQTPFATVLTCADSRVPLERLFDAGVGEVFGVRVAGNVAGESELGTIEYGVGHLRTPLLVVMGHTRCGAVAAAASGASVHGKVAGLIDRIRPAVERARRANPDASAQQIADLAVQENVWQTVYDVFKHSPEVRELVAAGRLTVVGAVYDITSGRVQFTGEHPWQAELLTALGADGPAAGAAAAHATGTPSGTAAAATPGQSSPPAAPAPSAIPGSTTATAERSAEPATDNGGH